MDYTCKDTIIRNMKDAGCNEKIINDFLNCFERCDIRGQQEILKSYRKTLLNDIHQKQIEIDYLDFLMYQLNKCNCKLSEKEKKQNV